MKYTDYIQTSLRSGAFIVAALSLLVLPLITYAPTSAHEDNESESSDTTTSTDGTETEIETEIENETENEHRAAVQERVSAAKDRAQKSLSTLNDQKTQRTEDQRLKICQNREKAVNNKISAFSKAGDTQITRLETAYTKLTTYQLTNNVTVTNFAELTDTADAKQQAAVNAVDAMQAVATDIKCSSPDVAVNLATIKEAGLTARQALRDYRSALHDILVALVHATAPETDTTETTGGTE